MSNIVLRDASASKKYFFVDEKKNGEGKYIHFVDEKEKDDIF